MSMFIEAQFTIAKLWNQSWCPATEEQMKKIWCIYTMECFSSIKKDEIMAFASKWMELKTIISQSQKYKG